MNKLGTVVEHSNEYFEEVIINHPKHGLLYARQAQDNDTTPPNWYDGGMVCQVLKGDTIDSLNETIINKYGVTVTERMMHGYDEERQLLDWTPNMVENMVVAAMDNK